MSEKKNKYDVLTNLFNESNAYTSIDEIERYVENSNELQNLPVQPTYLALKILPLEKVAEFLPKFSKEQREVFMDIDLWNKDEVDLMQFSYWLSVYTMVDSDEVKKEFVTSEQFLLFLKGRCNIWTFDAEEPEYPDHDRYFLTDDNMLLVEYDESFDQVDELREMIRHLYYEIGVEYAYTFLFKLVTDSFLILQEDLYQQKINRLRDYGFVDYLEALEIENTFISKDHLDNYIAKKTTATGAIDENSKNQNLHNSSLLAFKDQFKTVIDELLKIEDNKRSDYLQFNFVRLINSRLEFKNALKNGSVAMMKASSETKNTILLGFNYLKENLNDPVFLKFDFLDLYKIGNSLFKFKTNQIKKALKKFSFEGERENFLGETIIEILDNSFSSTPKLYSSKLQKSISIVDITEYKEWEYQINCVIDLLPKALEFYNVLFELKKNNSIMESYYLNYSLAEIDFEVLLLSNFANFINLTNGEVKENKLGLTVLEFRKFIKYIISSEGKFILTPEIFKKIQNFLVEFEMDKVFNSNQYIQDLIIKHLEGPIYESLEDSELMHVGGPLILNF